MTKFYEIVDRESTNSSRANNGGDYTEGHDLVVDESGKVVAGRFWTSAEFEYCPHSGRYGRCDEFYCDGYEGPVELTGGRWVETDVTAKFYKVQQ